MPRYPLYADGSNAKYRTGLPDEALEELARGQGKAPEELAAVFGVKTPRRLQTYSFSKLVNALEGARHFRSAVAQSVDWEGARMWALARAFGIEPSGLPGYIQLLIRRQNQVSGPFGVYLEGGPGKAEKVLRARHEHALKAANDRLKAHYSAAIFDAIKTHYPELVDKTVDSDELLAAGFDDDLIDPDPDNF